MYPYLIEIQDAVDPMLFKTEAEAEAELRRLPAPGALFHGKFNRDTKGQVVYLSAPVWVGGSSR